MAMIWRMSTPTREDREKADATPYCSGDFVTKIINLVISRHQLATNHHGERSLQFAVFHKRWRRR